MSRKYNYWVEAIKAAADEAGVTISDEQAETMAHVIEGAAETKGEVTGEYCIPNPLVTEIEQLKRKVVEVREAGEHAEHVWKTEACNALRVDPKTVWRDGDEVWSAPR